MCACVARKRTVCSSSRLRMTVLSIAVFLIFVIRCNDSARILAVFPTPSISHQLVFRPLTQELAKKGHEVVIITPDPAFSKGNTPPNLTEIDVHNISYGTWRELYKLTSKGDGEMISHVKLAFMMIKSIVQEQLKTKEVQRLIKEESFDLLFLEACARPALMLSYVFNAPVIQIGSLGFLNYNVETIGASGHPLLFPSVFTQRVYNLTKWEKIVTLWNNYKTEEIIKSIEDIENENAKELFGPNIPTIDELKKNVSMKFLNVHPIWESNRPVPPGVIYIWGIHEHPRRNYQRYVCQ